MKPLKITLLLVVFVLCVSGNNNKIETQKISLEEIQKIDKDEFKLLVLDTDKKKKPRQNNL